MRKYFGAKPICYPQPVFIIATYNEDGTPNAMNAAWGGISMTQEISICVSPGHKTISNVTARKAFTVSMGTVDMLPACDFVGVVSGKNVPDKFERAGFHAEAAKFVDAPLIKELPMALECRLISYNPETHRLLGEIVDICADESILNENGKVDPKKLRAITFDPMNNAYISLGNKVGNAFKDGLALK